MSTSAELNGVCVVKVGTRVELRSPAEILATLDENGCLEGVPFMPEMLGFFGKVVTVDAEVARACDTVHYSGVRRLRNTVLLDDLRCDGTAHAGCGAQCRLYWKEAWLRPTSSHEISDPPTNDAAFEELERLVRRSVHGHASTAEEPIFRCQATELLRASEPVGRWSTRSFLHELTSGNVTLWRFVRVMTRIIVEAAGRRLGLGLGSSLPFRESEMTGHASEPPALKGLRPGELVQIRSGNEIRKTLTSTGANRGLWFDREMKVYCGKTARVKAKVERFIDEGSGRLVELASDCYILDDVACESYRSNGRWFCPRGIYPWWRECWLRPVEKRADESRED